MNRSWLRIHLPELVLLCVALVMLFVKLGIGELESSDEALYVIRAVAATTFGVWLDQTDYAVGGLYSSTHPPLGIWLIALSRALFGESELASRLPSAFAGVMASLGLLVLLRRFTTDRIAILLSAIFASCSLFSWYSRHAQLDSLLIALGIWTIVLVHRSLNRNSLHLAAIAGVLFGLALMSKFFWGVFVLPYVCWIIATADNKDKMKIFVWMTIVAALIASPWYTYMLSIHPDFLTHAIGVSTVSGYEAGKQHSISYYLNQVLVNSPFVLAGILLLRKDRRSKSAIGAIMWFTVVLAGLLMMATTMPHFTLMLLPAAFLLSAVVIGREVELPVWGWVVLSLSILWSLSAQVRLWVKGTKFTFILPDITLIAVCGVCLLILLALTWRGRTRSELAFLSMAGVFVTVSAVKVLSYSEDVFTDGAKELAAKLNADRHITKLISLHSSLAKDDLATRLAYYTDGWTLGWLPGKAASALHWDDPNIFVTLSTSIDSNTAVVIERDWDRFHQPPHELRDQMAMLKSLLRSRYSEHDSMRSYDLFYK